MQIGSCLFAAGCCVSFLLYGTSNPLLWKPSSLIRNVASDTCIIPGSAYVLSHAGTCPAPGEDRMMVKLMAVVEKLQQELFDVEKSRKEAEACVPLDPQQEHCANTTTCWRDVHQIARPQRDRMLPLMEQTHVDPDPD